MEVGVEGMWQPSAQNKVPVLHNPACPVRKAHGHMGSMCGIPSKAGTPRGRMWAAHLHGRTTQLQQPPLAQHMLCGVVECRQGMACQFQPSASVWPWQAGHAHAHGQ